MRRRLDAFLCQPFSSPLLRPSDDSTIVSLWKWRTTKKCTMHKSTILHVLPNAVPNVRNEFNTLLHNLPNFITLASATQRKSNLSLQYRYYNIYSMQKQSHSHNRISSVCLFQHSFCFAYVFKMAKWREKNCPNVHSASTSLRYLYHIVVMIA